MEYLIEYGVFLAKAVTIIIGILLVISAIAGAGHRGGEGKKGAIKVDSLNDSLDETAEQIRQELVSEAEAKIIAKKKKKDEKEKKKAEKQAAKEIAKKAKKGSSPEQSAAADKTADADADADTAVKADDANESNKEQGDNDVLDSRNKMFVLDFDGDIKASEVEMLRREITAVLSIAGENDEVLIRLESPGGMVHGYGLAASQLQRIKDANLKLTVCVDQVAASGGYMMACIADKIVAAPFAILGSIGVVAQLPNIHRLLKKNDIDVELHTAGEYKRTLTTIGENTDEARAKFKEELEDTHLLFKDFVSEHRPVVDIEKVATGEHWFGLRAKDLNLVDEIKTSDQTIVDACKDYQVFSVHYEERRTLASKLGLAVEESLMRLSSKAYSKIARSHLL